MIVWTSVSPFPGRLRPDMWHNDSTFSSWEPKATGPSWEVHTGCRPVSPAYASVIFAREEAWQGPFSTENPDITLQLGCIGKSLERRLGPSAWWKATCKWSAKPRQKCLWHQRLCEPILSASAGITETQRGTDLVRSASGSSKDGSG